MNSDSIDETNMDDIEEQFIDKMWSALEGDSDFLPVIDAWDKIADLNQAP